MEKQDYISLEGMLFYGYHGTRQEEKLLGQRFQVSVKLYMDLGPAGSSDSLGDTIDYGEVYREVRSILEGPSVNLLESLATHIATNLLHQFALTSVEVEVRKERVPIKDSILDAAVVTVYRKRDQT